MTGTTRNTTVSLWTVAVVLFVAEFAVMSVMPLLGFKGVSEDAVDALLLVLLSLPTLHAIGFRASFAPRGDDLRGLNRLERRTTALLLAQVVMITGVVATYALLTSEKSFGASVINQAGRQRMLAEKLANDTTVATMESIRSRQARSAAKEPEQVNETIAQFERTLKGLIEGDPELGLPPCPSEDAAKQLAAVSETWTEFRALAEHDPEMSTMDEAAAYFAGLRGAAERVRVGMERAVELLESHYRARLGTVRIVLGLAILVSAVTSTLLALVFFQMMRQRRWLNAQLEESEARMRAIVDGAAEAVICIDERGRIESFNAAAERMFGYAVDEAIGNNVSMLMPSPHREEHGRYLKKYLDTGKANILNTPREVIGRRKDGSLLPVELNVSEVVLGGRRLFTGIARDITEHRSLQRQLTQAQKLESIGQLAAGIAHEINTPIQFVGDNTRFLRDSFSDLKTLLDRYGELLSAARGGAVTKELIAEVEAAVENADIEYLVEETPKAIAQSLEGVERVAKIVRSMKEFSHPGGDRKQPVDLNKAIETTITVARNEWKYVADVVTDLDASLPLVSCHGGDINQVMLNMIVNAAHAIAAVVGDGSARKGTITIRTRRDGRWARIEISDTGAGIPERLRSKIFDPFFTTKEVGRGTGQGLAIAQSVIVKKHGGRIDVESEVDKGSKFIIRLPVGPGGGKAPPEGEPEEEAVCTAH